MGYFGVQDPETLLNTMVFIIGKGFALRVGKEHHLLRGLSFNSQFEFLHDIDGEIFIRYTEDLGLKTNKEGIKQRKVEVKEVDLYQIEDPHRWPVKYFSHICRSCQNRKNVKHSLFNLRRSLLNWILFGFKTDLLELTVCMILLKSTVKLQD